MSRLYFLNRWRWPIRLPLKWGLFGLAVLIVCFPYPSRFLAHIRHWSDPNALVEPNAAAIQPFLEELRPKLSSDLSAKQFLGIVESYVYRKIPYKWDWETWGMADYLPTVTEAIEMGYEDCDGRAVVAASILTHFGYDAKIVTDFTHVWVKTEHGEAMGPGKKKAVVATETGLEVRMDALAQLPRALAYGIAVFPWERELILILVAWLLMLRCNGGAYCNGVALGSLLIGWLFLRAGSVDHRSPVLWLQLIGLASSAAGVFSLLVWAHRNVRAAVEPAPKSDFTPALPDGTEL